jgi:hypothetical protein
MLGLAEKLYLTLDELKNIQFLSISKDGNTAIYLEASTGSKEFFEDLLDVYKVKQLHPDDLRKLLVSAWHNAAARGYLRAF